MIMKVIIITKKEVIPKLMQAAFQIFGQKGYEKATIDEIVALAGYSKGAFYYYFSSKEDLFLEIMDYRVSAQQEIFTEALKTEQSLHENISNIFRLFVQMTKEDQWVPIYVEFLAQAARNEKVKMRMAYMYSNWRSFLAGIINKIKEVKMIPETVDAEIAAGLIIALFDGFNMQNLVEPGVLKEEVLVQALTTILGQG